MNNLQFIKKLYNGKNCYSDSMGKDEIQLLHIKSGIEEIANQMLNENRMVFLTGNPGDGKTYIIRALSDSIDSKQIYVETDLNSVSDKDMDEVIIKLVDCYNNNKACLIAANEFPFFKLIKAAKKVSIDFYKEIAQVKENVIISGYPTIQLHRICIIDLNERNLLDKDRSVVIPIVKKFTGLLKGETGGNRCLDYNVNALQNEHILGQLVKIFSLVALSGLHFAIRDILGTISYVLAACTFEESNEELKYYDAFFSKMNELMRFAARFDPIYLSLPQLDEKLWNGEFLEGWLLEIPEKWPKDLISGDMEEAREHFRSLKRKFYFENIYADKLSQLQPIDYIECEKIFVNLYKDKKSIKRMLIHSMNRLFLSTDEEKEKLRIWTSHNFDLSRDASAIVSTKYVDSQELDLLYPQPISWLQKMEFAPSYIIMKLKTQDTPHIEISVDFLRSLIAIKNGYPANLLSKQYEQEITQFTQELEISKASRDYGDGEIIVASRKDGSCKKIYIENNKYSFSEGGEY